MRRKQTEHLRALSESALMIALATVLGFIKIIDMPYGGAVTVASMLPVAIISYRHGLKSGLFTATVYGAIQQILGLSMLSWATSWQAVVAIVLLDYIIAFAVIGFAGMFRKAFKNQAVAITLGCFAVSLMQLQSNTTESKLNRESSRFIFILYAFNVSFLSLPLLLPLLSCVPILDLW